MVSPKQSFAVSLTLISNTASNNTAEFVDLTLCCIDCTKDFIWTGGEQLFFRDKGLQNPPKRCKQCKQAKNNRIATIAAAQSAGVHQKIEVAVHCAHCEAQTTVPFYPSQGRPVYCRACFLKFKAEG